MSLFKHLQKNKGFFRNLFASSFGRNEGKLSFRILTSRNKSSKIALVFIVLSLIGFFDATYLTIEHYLGATVPCSITQGCEKVLSSPYATVGTVPIALLGSLYYFSIFLGSFISLRTRNKQLLFSVAQCTVAGFVASLWLLYLQLFIISSICFYCMISAMTSMLLFGVGLGFILGSPKGFSWKNPVEDRSVHKSNNIMKQ